MLRSWSFGFTAAVSAVLVLLVIVFAAGVLPFELRTATAAALLWCVLWCLLVILAFDRFGLRAAWLLLGLPIIGFFLWFMLAVLSGL